MLNVGKLEVDFSLDDYVSGSYSLETNLMARLVAADSNVPVDVTSKSWKISFTAKLVTVGRNVVLGCFRMTQHFEYFLKQNFSISSRMI